MFESSIHTESEFRAVKKYLREIRDISERMREDKELPVEWRIYLWRLVVDMRKATRIWGYNNQRKP